MYYLQKVLDFFSIVVVAFATDTLSFADVACSARGLDILEMDQRILADIDDGSQVVV